MQNIDLIQLGSKIREARKDCNLTQTELAEQAGISLKTLRNIEKGLTNPYYDTLYRLIYRLGISANTLFNQEIPEQENLIQQLTAKLESCTAKKRQFIIVMLTAMIEGMRCFD